MNKYIILIIIILSILILLKIYKHENIENITTPTFHILVATKGRPSLINLLNSLKKQLRYNDAITIVFDGPNAYKKSNYNNTWIKNHISQINIIIESSNLGYWGYPIRQKYVSLLKPKTTFIMHADDDNYYLPNSFNELRKICTNPNTLYISKMIFFKTSRMIMPQQNKKIIIDDIDTANGIIPFDLAPYGKWENIYDGDFHYYDSLQHYINNIIFLDTVIYKKNNINIQ